MDKIKDKPSSVTSSNSGANGKPKEKRRSNEKRKEKCRDAARYRRSRETEIFSELAHVLPLRREDIDQLDKASIMRLSIAFLKVRDMLNLFPKIQNLPAEKENSKDQDEDDDDDVADEKPADMLKSSDAHKLLTQALDGFLMILSSDGDVTYVSENISEFLGIAQIDILGQQIWEYSHQCDHDELKQVLNVRRSKAKDDKNEDKNPDGLITAHCDLFVRFKCTLTSRGRNVNIKSASYKVIHVTGHTVMNSENESLLIAVCRPLPHPSNIEIPLGSTTFLTKHSLDMKFTYVDDKMLSLLGYEPEDLLGKSLYNCHHGADSESLMTSFKNVIRKGQAETGRYRFLGKCGGYSWIVTQATIIYDKQKPQGVVCVNYVISDIENDDEIYSNLQLDASKEKQQHKQQEQQVEQPQKSVEIKDLQKENIHNNQCNTNRKLLQQKRSLLQEQHKEQQQQQQEQVNTVKREALSPIRKPSVNNNNNNNNNIINKISVAKSPTGKVIQSPTSPLSPLSPLSPVPTKISSAPSSPVVHITPRIRSNSNSAIVNNYKSNFNKINRLQQSPQKLQHQHQQQQQQQKQQQQQQQQQQQTKLQEDKKRPKSVTASVFTPVPLNDNILNHSVTLNQLNNINFGNNNHNPSNNNNNNNNNNRNNCSPPLPFTKAQSVTASVLTPLSALPDLANRSLFNSSLALSSITSKSHMPRTEDMNKAFLMFPEDNSDLTMLKEDPDDLTHLAPTAGDACIPLDDTAPLFGEVLEGLILTDSYGTLLPDDINSLDSQHSTGNNGKTHIDPFINYRDESSDTSNSPHLLSPGGASKSPEASSLPSLCSPNSLSQEDEFAFMTMNIQDDIDLSMRAPYIPMNEQDDLPLLTDDLMWSAFSDDITLHKDALQIENIKNHNNNSANTNATISNNNNSSLNNNCTTTSNSSSTSSTTTNSNISNTESSLAALLCGNISIQHQQHQQQTNQDLSDHHSNEEKKFKTIIRDDNEQLVDPIDAFINNKSTNLECWTMNDLLQLNTSTTAQLNHEQTTTIQPQKQNIVINEVIPTTLHIPIVRINNPNKKCNGTKGIITNNNSSNNNNNNNSNNIINSTANISTTPMTIVYSNSSNNKKLTTKLLNASITSNNLTNNNYNTITTTNSNMTNNHIQSTNGSNCNITTTSNSNKRPSNVASSMDTKRVKGAQTIEIQASPQLLQQLMAPTPQRQKHKSAYDKLQSNRWNAEGCGGGGGQQPNGLPPPASNSVLKNLLVSGCDDTFTCRTPDLVLEEGIENNDFVEDQCELSKTNCFNKPLHCTTSGTAMLRNYANPLIGGVGILPSPPMPMSEDDGNNPVGPQQPLSPCFSAMDTDSRGSADSGIECGTNSNDPKSKSKVSPLATNSIGANDNNPSMKNNIASTSKVSASRSLSFLDPDNPLCSSFLLDFCTDDYNMNEPITNALLEDTELGKVLSEWT